MRYLNVFIIFSLIVTIAYRPSSSLANWEDRQAAIFEKIDVKPGDVIDRSNFQKVENLLLPSIAEWVKKGDFTMEIAALEWCFQSEEKWHMASQGNSGKYNIGEDGEIYDTASGKPPAYIYGEPFPNIDWKTDPRCAEKQVYNTALIRSRVGNYENAWTIDLVERKGLSKYFCGKTMMQFFWGTDTPADNPAKYLSNMIVSVSKPYNYAGNIYLFQRFCNKMEDQCYFYIKTVRQVKCISSIDRSTSFLNSDFTFDTDQVFSAKITSMDWIFIEKKVLLLPINKFAAKGPVKFIQQPDGAWQQPVGVTGPMVGFDTAGWQGAPWAITDIVYVPREMYIVKATPKNRYYNYGESTYAIDPTVGFVWGEINNRGKELFKSLMATWLPAEWQDKVTFATPVCTVIVDAKSDHASIKKFYGATHDNILNSYTYNLPRLTQARLNRTTFVSVGE